ncbi:hypothetical protein HU200_050078 [Digitaria exilis]|uniref:Trichome birefringence-like C-terminal domain-containing protein n=1 Tax=Digitaria exilis TaxID=1010633 RepID=A0A835E9E4_9POAL|nr:hypothetical protein HU200_050078 [Digitaria exilis]
MANPASYADCMHWCLPGVPDQRTPHLITAELGRMDPRCHRRRRKSQPTSLPWIGCTDNIPAVSQPAGGAGAVIDEGG